jgi:hypothetical protein
LQIDSLIGNNFKQIDFLSLNSISNSDDNQNDKIKVSKKNNSLKNEMSLLSNYLLTNELNVVITSSSENSSLDSYELEFENDVK